MNEQNPPRAVSRKKQLGQPMSQIVEGATITSLEQKMVGARPLWSHCAFFPIEAIVD